MTYLAIFNSKLLVITGRYIYIYIIYPIRSHETTIFLWFSYVFPVVFLCFFPMVFLWFSTLDWPGEGHYVGYTRRQVCYLAAAALTGVEVDGYLARHGDSPLSPAFGKGWKNRMGSFGSCIVYRSNICIYIYIHTYMCIYIHTYIYI